MKYVLKHIAGLLLLVFSVLAHANMGSPETTGTQAGTGHFSHDIDILSVNRPDYIGEWIA